MNSHVLETYHLTLDQFNDINTICILPTYLLFFSMINIKISFSKQLKLPQQYFCGQKCDLPPISHRQLSIAGVNIKGCMHDVTMVPFLSKVTDIQPVTLL